MLLLLDNMDWKSTLPVMYFEQSGNIRLHTPQIVKVSSGPTFGDPVCN